MGPSDFMRELHRSYEREQARRLGAERLAHDVAAVQGRPCPCRQCLNVAHWRELFEPVLFPPSQEMLLAMMMVDEAFDEEAGDGGTHPD